MPSKKAGRKKRWNFWPHPSFQKRFIRQVTVCAFVGALVASSIVFLSLLKVLDEEFSDHRFERQIKTFAAVKWVQQSGAFDQSLLENPDILKNYQKRVYSRALEAAGGSFLISILILLPLMALAGILMSHRMVGAVARIESHLEKIRKGEFYETLVCREGDDMQPLVESLSAIDRNYVRRLKKIKESTEKIRETMKIFRLEAGEEKYKRILQEYEAALVQIERALKATGF